MGMGDGGASACTGVGVHFSESVPTAAELKEAPRRFTIPNGPPAAKIVKIRTQSADERTPNLIKKLFFLLVCGGS